MVEYYWYQAFCLIFIESKTRDEDTISRILYFLGELIHFVIFIPGTVKYKFGFWKFLPESIMSRNVEVKNIKIENVEVENIKIEYVEVENVKIEYVEVENRDHGSKIVQGVAEEDISFSQSPSTSASDQITEKETLKTRGLLLWNNETDLNCSNDILLTCSLTICLIDR